MTLQELKARATAAELTLIERTEALLRPDVENSIRDKVLSFCNRNMPPSREEVRMGGKELADRWLQRLDDAITGQPKP